MAKFKRSYRRAKALNLEEPWTEQPTEPEENDLINLVNRLIDYVQYQNERIDALTDLVYKIAPEIEIIETMAEDPEQEDEMIRSYMNQNPDYALD